MAFFRFFLTLLTVFLISVVWIDSKSLFSAEVDAKKQTQSLEEDQHTGDMEEESEEMEEGEEEEDEEYYEEEEEGKEHPEKEEKEEKKEKKEEEEYKGKILTVGIFPFLTINEVEYTDIRAYLPDEIYNAFAKTKDFMAVHYEDVEDKYDEFGFPLVLPFSKEEVDKVSKALELDVAILGEVIERKRKGERVVGIYIQIYDPKSSEVVDAISYEIDEEDVERFLTTIGKTVVEMLRKNRELRINKENVLYYYQKYPDVRMIDKRKKGKQPKRKSRKLKKELFIEGSLGFGRIYDDQMEFIYGGNLYSFSLIGEAFYYDIFLPYLIVGGRLDIDYLRASQSGTYNHLAVYLYPKVGAGVYVWKMFFSLSFYTTMGFLYYFGGEANGFSKFISVAGGINGVYFFRYYPKRMYAGGEIFYRYDIFSDTKIPSLRFNLWVGFIY